MKKLLSVILSAVLMCSTLALGNFSASAAAKAVAAEITLSKSVNLTVLPTDLEDENADLESVMKTAYYAKFKAPSKGYYAFRFAAKYDIATPDDNAGLIAVLYDSKDEMVEMSMAVPTSSLTEKDLKEAKEEGLDMTGYDDLSFTVELAAGKTYYILVVNSGKEEYVSKLTVEKHKHTFKTETRKATVEDSWYIEGGKYYVCKDPICEYEELDEEIVAVKYIGIEKTKYAYNGKAKKPEVTIKLENDKVLSPKYYSVKYKKNKKVGRGSVVITFKGKYDGKATKEFKIVPKGTKIAKLTAKKKGFTVKYKKQSKQTTGYQIQYALNKKFTKGKTTITVKDKKKTSKTVKKLKKNKKYYVRVRTYKVVDGKKLYSKWSKKEHVKTK